MVVTFFLGHRQLLRCGHALERFYGQQLVAQPVVEALGEGGLPHGGSDCQVAHCVLRPCLTGEDFKIALTIRGGRASLPASECT